MHETNDGQTIFSSKLEERVVFFLVSVGIIALTYGFFFIIDFLPEKPTAESESEEVRGDAKEEVISAPVLQTPEPEVIPPSIDPLPVSIVIDALDKEIKVLNPESSDVATLDNALLSGVVRHPGSADFENEGTVFILGHSSYLPKVNNKNFQAFNGIQKLAWGDTIRLRSSDMEYVYSVDRVYEVKASAAEVPIEHGTPKLVLATCNSFGTKDDRFIVEASFVSARPIGS